MNVLLLEYDLFKSVGGGQTVYKRLIASNPEIDFHYLGRQEPADAPRPANARMVPFREAYSARDLTGEFSGIDFPLWAYSDFIEASNIAASVEHLRIDVADIPDYRPLRLLPGPGAGAPRAEGLPDRARPARQPLRDAAGELGPHRADRPQRRPAGAMAVSRRRHSATASAAITSTTGGPSRAGPATTSIPCVSLAPPQPGPWDRRAGGVSLNFVGRTEGFKGPDLFLELLAWLPRRFLPAGADHRPERDRPGPGQLD